MLERMVKPHGRRGAAEQVVVSSETMPDQAWVTFRLAAIGARNSEVGQRHSLTCQHSEHIVIGNDDQFRRIGKAFVFGEPAWLAMTMRADDGKIPDGFIKGARHVAETRLYGKQPVRICEGHPAISRLAPAR